MSGGMMFPKQKGRKKRKRHKPSILQDRTDGICYLCARLHGDYRIHRYREEHHIFNGPNREHSEAEGMKVYLCLEHHRTGPEAVHRNGDTKRLLQQDAQRVYEETHTRQQFMKLFGENYL